MVNYFIFAVLCFLISCGQSDLEKGAVSLSIGDYERAIAFYDQELNKRPSNAIAHLGLGKSLYQKAMAQKNDTVSLAQAIIHIEAARTLGLTGEVNGLLSSVLTGDARMKLNTGDTIGALEILTRAIEYDRSSSVPLNLTGIIYFRTGRTEKASVLFDYAIKTDTSDVSPLFNRGMVAWQQNQFETAHVYWLKALRKSPDDEEILYWFARAEKLLRNEEQGTLVDGGSK
ncbi:MAG TPA: tetratricopeptide repeat protein [Chitinispirillaceae bacterium]|nr:tetratricopeptide repeat protein [Chitinispirillaceae bacterium]